MSEPDFLSRRDALGEGHPSQRELDKARLEEPGTEATRAHVETCAVCQARVAAAEKQDAQYAASTFVAKEAQAVSKRARQPPRKLVAGIGIALAAGLALFIVPALLKPPDGERVKGSDPELVVYRHREGRVEKVNDGDTLKAGDALRFEVVLPRPSHVVILGVDGARTVTPYVPAAGVATVLSAGRHALPEAVKLDAVTGEERVVATVCEHGLTVDDARRLLQADATREDCVVKVRHYLKR